MSICQHISIYFISMFLSFLITLSEISEPIGCPVIRESPPLLRPREKIINNLAINTDDFDFLISIVIYNTCPYFLRKNAQTGKTLRKSHSPAKSSLFLLGFFVLRGRISNARGYFCFVVLLAVSSPFVLCTYI